MKNNSLIKLVFLTFLIFFSVFICYSNNVYAEGSIDFVRNAPPESYRAHLEWQAGNTLGIPRRSILKVYAKAGEIINLGSSVYNSYDNRDIVVTYPDGSSAFFDVLQTGYGYLNTLEKEQIGPFPEIGGYTPIQIEVIQERNLFF